MTLITEDIIKLLLAILAGGLIGAEREFRDKAAGFRTIILICVGAALFTMFSLRLGADRDPVRIAASIVSGVGFLGAGAILRSDGRIVGLTTASTIWLAAALGMGIGGGQYLISSLGAVVVLLVLWIFPKIEALIDNVREIRTYEVVCQAGTATYAELDSLFRDRGLRVSSRSQSKSGDVATCTWEAHGSPDSHARLIATLLDHEDIRQFRT